MKWSGKVLDGAGMSTGESTELVNSFLSRLGAVTRHMSIAGKQRSMIFWKIDYLLILAVRLCRLMSNRLHCIPLVP